MFSKTVKDRSLRMAAVLAVSGAMVLAMPAYSRAGSTAADAPFVLGVGTPLTGNNAQYGIASKIAYETAAKYINSHGGMNGHKLVLDFWDTAAQPATGVAGTQKFISSKVNAVAGYFNSDVTIPAVRLLSKANIPLFGDNPSSPALMKLGLKNFTRVTGNDKNEGLVQAYFTYKILGKKTAVVIDDNEAFGQAFAQAFIDEYTKLGGKVLKHLSIDGTVTDYTSVINQIKGLNPEVLDYAGFNPATAQLVKQARAAGLNAVYVADSATYGSDFTRIAGDASHGAYITMSLTANSTDNEFYKLLDAALKAKNIDITPIYMVAFDTALDVWHAANLAKSIEPEALIKVMHNVSFEGITGKVSFLPDGDRAEVRYTVDQVQPDNSYKVVYTYEQTLK